ncbi:hydroxyacid dehydrogenase [Acidocella sp. MX-AZ02]|uniref:hydroxyacid dehydrogenase n=1 Tax=Acidocella sp. MX-AZ02 TaxID=1214225 RepID=UPI00034A3834|nr:hydroxyacid dehydrogenase [Acidocella sp. MX-AZ02]
MGLTVVTLGGALAPEGEALLAQAGIKSVSTQPYPGKDEVIALLAQTQADAVVVRLVDRLDAEIMRASPKLKIIAKHGAGTNDIDVAAAGALNIPVIAAVGANAHSVAEHTIALMLGLAKDMRNQDAFVRQGGWDKTFYKGRELRGSVLGLIGAGMIGRLVAGMARALGLSVLCYDPYAPTGSLGEGIERTDSLESLLRQSDIVSLHCPLTEATRGLINAQTLALMKPSAFLINTARGEVVDEPALLAALTGGRIAGAGLDSFAQEPPAADNPLWGLENVIVSSHCGGVTPEARREVSLMSVRNVMAFLNGEVLAQRLFVKG